MLRGVFTAGDAWFRTSDLMGMFKPVKADLALERFDPGLIAEALF